MHRVQPNIHPQEGCTANTCDICGRSFIDTKALNAHMVRPGRSHSRNDPSYLKVCGLKRARDGYIVHVVLKCRGCKRYPIAVPLASDRNLDSSGLSMVMASLNVEDDSDNDY